jgi:hypothetical protein
MVNVFKDKTVPTEFGSLDVWGALLNAIVVAANKWVTERQASIVLPLSKGNGTYRLVTQNRIPCTIEALSYSTDTGTATISNVSIGASPIVGLSSLSATTTPQNATATADNIYNSGNLSMAVANITGATELYLNFRLLQTDERT